MSEPSKAVPTEEELAAIVAAVETAWPRPIVVPTESGPRLPVWRFSGRWWLPRGPVAASRHRP